MHFLIFVNCVNHLFAMELILALTLFLLLLVLVLRTWKQTKPNHKRLNLPPGPWKLPIIGNMHQMVGSSIPYRRLRDLAKEYGPLMHLQLGEVTSIVISSPEMAKEVMKTHDLVFCDRPFVLALDIMVYNSADMVMASYGKYWRQMRKLCTVELLSARRLQSFQRIRDEETSRLVRSLSSAAGSVINISDLLISSAYTIIARMAFGKECKGQDEFIPVVKEFMKMAGGFSVVDLFPSFKFLRVISRMEATLRKMHRQLDSILESIISDHKASKTEMAANREAEDLVHVLLNLQENGDRDIPLSDNNIKAVILDVFIAGSETTSTTVEWAISELLKSPKAMRKAQAEVRQLFHEQGEVVEAGIQELKYLKLVVKETLRLHPPGPLLLPRECREQCEINGYDIPAKAKVLVNAWALGRDPKYWIEPESFIPERFLKSSIDYKGVNFEYIPFGAGRRICPGILTGIANVELSLAKLLYHLDWGLPGGTRNEDLDMTEEFGHTVRRMYDLHVVPTPYHPLAE